VSESSAGQAPKDSEVDPPAANQAGDEPVPTTPDESAQSGAADPADNDQGAGAQAMTEQTSGTGDIHESATGGVPTPGDSQGVAVPAVQAAAGTSEEQSPVKGVRIPANAPPGKPDGEVDTRS
jgi:hypothetical protein